MKITYVCKLESHVKKEDIKKAMLEHGGCMATEFEYRWGSYEVMTTNIKLVESLQML